MKTLIVYELVPEETKFFIVDGDRSELNGCFVNTEDEEKFSAAIRREVGDISQNEHWAEVKAPVSLSGGDFVVVHCGFVL